MVKKQRYRLISYLIIFILFCNNLVFASIKEDYPIASQPIDASYRGREFARNIMTNINFSDLSTSEWAREPIVRLGALGVVNGFNKANRHTYKPEKNTSNEEVLALILRMLGHEEDAKKEAEKIGNQEGQGPLGFWSRGYLKLAKDMGAITNDEYMDAFLENDELEEGLSFFRSAPAKREDVARWLVILVNKDKPDLLKPIYENQAVFNYSDWQAISPEKIPYVEAVTSKGFMKGTNRGQFLPKNPISRAEMAQVIYNMSDLLYETMGLELKNGYIGHQEERNDIKSNTSSKERVYLVRNQDGRVSELIYKESQDSRGIRKIYDSPTFKAGKVISMQNLKQGDNIEYLVNNADEVIYIKHISDAKSYKVSGDLLEFNNFEKGLIRLRRGNEEFEYQMNTGLYDLENKMLRLNDTMIPLEEAPISNVVTLTIKNKLVTMISYEGDKYISNEISGIIKEIDTDLKYVVIEKWQGGEVTKYFRESDLSVEKRAYYDENNDIGYIDQLFPNYKFDSFDGKISDFEPGDVVHMRLNPKEPSYFNMISGASNYQVVYGSLEEVSHLGDQGTRIRVKKTDASIGVYDIASDVHILNGDILTNSSQLRPGQLLRLLINQAVIEPGHLRENVKEVVIEPKGNKIANIYKGNMGSVNEAQKEFSLYNAYRLDYKDWSDYKEVFNIKRSDKKMEVYYDGKRIDFDYAKRFLRNEDITAYVITEDKSSSEEAIMVSFRNSRESMMPRDHISGLAGWQSFYVSKEDKPISVDQGTIITKDGHLVSFANVIPPDYARVILNGPSKAAVLAVEKEAENNDIKVFRGRIKSIEEGRKLQVSSFASLTGMEWIYSPIERIFDIDYKTKIIGTEGKIKQADFIDYSEISQVDKVYTIVAQGSKASYIVDQPYVKEGLKGEVYAVEDDQIKLKDIYVFNSKTKKWSELSTKNNYGFTKLPTNAMIFRNNERIDVKDLRKGEKLRVLTGENMAQKLKVKNDRTVTGHIFFVEE